MTAGDRIQRMIEQERFERWVKARPNSHEGGHFLPNDRLYWTPLTKPLSECNVALMTSIGVHLKGQEPFDILAPRGDPSFREIPGDVDSAELMATHGHVDTDPANQDINCVFPIDRLRELVAEGRVGRVADTHYGFMGFCPAIELMRDELGPELARRLKAQQVDAVVITAG
jgi:D-proline reductase (dithiol) PrdB